jgi:hypothetical protein
MAEFIADQSSDRSPTAHLPTSPTPPPPPPPRRPLRVLLLGDREDVLETIKNLHRRGFAPAGEWSKAIACPHAGEVVSQVVLSLPAESVLSILTKYLN